MITNLTSTEIIVAVIMALSTIIVAYFNLAGVKERKIAEKRQKALQESLEKRSQESLLSMRMMNSVGLLSVVIAKAVTGQKTNGDVEEAMLDAKKARAEYNEFMENMANKSVHDQDNY